MNYVNTPKERAVLRDSMHTSIFEQTNKTSVELFQLYDDARKRGINVPIEKEFRAYYALLKLDKHPVKISCSC